MRQLGLVLGLYLVATATHAGASIISFVQANTNGQNGVAGLKQGYRLGLSPDAEHLYAVSQGDHALVTFARDAATGTLSQIDEIQDGVDGATGLGIPEGVEVSSDGKNVYVADAGIDALSAYTRDPATGLVTYRSRQMHGVGGVVGLNGVGGLVLSPDGKFVYGTDSNRISTFARDPGTGDLALVDELSANTYSGMGFGNGTSMVITADGKHLYASGTFANNLVVFARNQLTGKLTFVEERLQNVEGVTGLALAWAITASPDGKNIYVSGTSYVSTFTRDATTGSVTYQGKLEQGVGGVDGMKVPFALTATPDGKLVLVNGASDSGVAAFARDPMTGALTFVDAFLSPSAGLYQVRKTVVSPDSKFLYTITLDTHTVGVYAIDAAGAPATTTSSSTTSSTSTSSTTTTKASPSSSTTTSAAPTTSSTTTTTVAGPTTTTLPGCSAIPLVTCRAAGPHDGPALRIVDDASPDKDRVVWTWRRGAATTLADLGDPKATTSYRLCVYENAVQNASLVLDALAPAGGACGASSCWKVVPKKGVRYRDRSGSSNGVVTVAIHAGGDGRAWIAVRSKGANLALPALPLLAPVTVQLQSSSGICWETIDSTD